MALLCSNCGAECLIDGSCPECGQLFQSGTAAAAASGPATGAQEGRPTKQCPYCAETILAAAIKCRHCGERLDVPVTPAAPPRPAATPPPPPARAVPGAGAQVPAEPWDAAQVAEFYRQLREIGPADERADPARRGLFARVLSKWPHFVLIVVSLLAGFIAYAVYHETVVRPAGYYSWDTYGNYYRAAREQRDMLAVVVPVGTFVLGEVLMWWRRRRKKRRA